MKIFAAAMFAALPVWGATALAQTTPVIALASVAHKLGLTYSYLGTDDEVSLTGHGMTITVRPGEPFFYANDRTEPVRGGTPVFRRGDVYVSTAFVGQLIALERTLGSDANAPHSEAMAAKNLGFDPMARSAPRKVTTLTMTGVAGSEDVHLAGDASPGTRVSIVLKAISSPLLPTIFINRSFAVADASGKYQIDVSTAPEYYAGSEFYAEASGVDDTAAIVAHYTPPVH